MTEDHTRYGAWVVQGLRDDAGILDEPSAALENELSERLSKSVPQTLTLRKGLLAAFC